MSNYAQTTFFGPKDALNSGDPNKVIHGTQVDTELANIATAIASKYDATSIKGITLPFGDGILTTPSITFNSDTSTGLYKSAAATLGVQANGALVASFAHTLVTLSSGVSLTVGGAVTASTGGSSIKGQLNLTAPATAVATLIATGPAGANAGLFAGSSTTGQSFGISTTAGTNSSDFSFEATNQAGSAVWFRVRGDGLVQVVDDGGTLQIAGFRGAPFRTASLNDTAVLSDRGKGVALAASGTFTIPNGVFSAGDMVVLLLGPSSTATIIQGTSFTLSWANGTTSTGNRTLTGVGMATVFFTASNSAFISGGGLS